MKRKREKQFVVPWFSRFDVLALGKQLFAEDVRERRRGLSRLAAWRARTYPKTPLSFDVTAELVTAVMSLEETGESREKMKGSISDSLTLTLSTCVVRYVTLVRDCKSQGGCMTPELQENLKQRLPELIELRNKIAHTGVFSWNDLVSAVKFALECVKLQYWMTADWMEAETSDEDDSVVITEEAITTALWIAQMKALKRVKNTNVRLGEQHVEYLKKQERESLVRFLVQHGFLILQAKETKLDQLKLNVSLLISRFWGPLINNLNIYNLATLIVRSLISDVINTSVEPDRKQVAKLWITGLLLKFPPDSPQQMAMLREPLIETTISDSTVELLKLLIDIKERSKKPMNFKGETSASDTNQRGWELFKGFSSCDEPMGQTLADTKWFPDKLLLK